MRNLLSFPIFLVSIALAVVGLVFSGAAMLIAAVAHAVAGDE